MSSLLPRISTLRSFVLLRLRHAADEMPTRLDAARKAAEPMGGKVHDRYLTIGHYDAVLVAEFPSDYVCAKLMLSVGAMGNVTTQTLKAFTENEFRNFISSLP